MLKHVPEITIAARAGQVGGRNCDDPCGTDEFGLMCDAGEPPPPPPPDAGAGTEEPP